MLEKIIICKTTAPMQTVHDFTHTVLDVTMCTTASSIIMCAVIQYIYYTYVVVTNLDLRATTGHDRCCVSVGR